jgi:hypothetical protein
MRITASDIKKLYQEDKKENPFLKHLLCIRIRATQEVLKEEGVDSTLFKSLKKHSELSDKTDEEAFAILMEPISESDLVYPRSAND